MRENLVDDESWRVLEKIRSANPPSRWAGWGFLVATGLWLFALFITGIWGNPGLPAVHAVCCAASLMAYAEIRQSRRNKAIVVELDALSQLIAELQQRKQVTLSRRRSWS